MTLTEKWHYPIACSKLIEVEAVRWQNSLTPLLYGWEGLNYESNEKRLKALDEARLTDVGLRSRLDKERKTLGDTSDFKELSSRLDERAKMMSPKRLVASWKALMIGSPETCSREWSV